MDDDDDFLQSLYVYGILETVSEQNERKIKARNEEQERKDKDNQEPLEIPADAEIIQPTVENRIVHPSSTDNEEAVPEKEEEEEEKETGKRKGQ